VHHKKTTTETFVFVTLDLHRGVPITHFPPSPSDKLLSAGSGLDPEADHHDAEAFIDFIGSERFGTWAVFVRLEKMPGN